MADVEPQEPTTLKEVDAALDEVYGEMLDINQKLVEIHREKASEAGELHDWYLEQAARCREIQALHAQRAVLIAGTIGDTFLHEFGDVFGLKEETSE
jgi:hypothetical protein